MTCVSLGKSPLFPSLAAMGRGHSERRAPPGPARFAGCDDPAAWLWRFEGIADREASELQILGGENPGSTATQACASSRTRQQLGRPLAAPADVDTHGAALSLFCSISRTAVPFVSPLHKSPSLRTSQALRCDTLCDFRAVKNPSRGQAGGEGKKKKTIPFRLAHAILQSGWLHQSRSLLHRINCQQPSYRARPALKKAKRRKKSMSRRSFAEIATRSAKTLASACLSAGSLPICKE